jgi:hypothetical protein
LGLLLSPEPRGEILKGLLIGGNLKKLPRPGHVEMSRMTAITRPHDLGRTEFAAPLQKPPTVGISVAHSLTIDGIDVKSHPHVMTRFGAVRSTRDSRHPEGIAPLDEITHRAKHP